MHFFVFVSTNEEDSVSRITVFTKTARKAYALAHNYFAKNNCEGEPTMIAI